MKEIIEYLQEELEDVKKAGGRGDGIIFITPDQARTIISALENHPHKIPFSEFISDKSRLGYWPNPGHPLRCYLGDYDWEDMFRWVDEYQILSPFEN